MPLHQEPVLDPDPAILDVTAQLEQEQDDLGQKAAALIFSTLPSYAGVDEASVHESVGRNIRRAIATLVSGTPPPAHQTGESAVTTAQRLSQGAPIEDIIRAYRVSLRVIHDRFLDLAEERGIPATRTLHYSNLLWEVGDWFTAGAAGEYRNHEVRSAVRDSVRQVELVRELLSGNLSDRQVRAAAATLALDPDETYAVFRIPDTGVSTAEMRARIDHLRPRPEVATESGASGWVGLTSSPDALDALGVVVAIGPGVGLVDLQASDDVATRILEILTPASSSVLARPRQSEGDASVTAHSYRLSDVTWRLVASDPVVQAVLVDTYIAPAERLGDFGELLLESVHTYLSYDLNIARSADALVVHQNTLRYRLSKFEEITGRRLSATNTVVELSWVLGLPIADHT